MKTTKIIATCTLFFNFTAHAALDCSHFTIISHRGLSGLYPEESQVAYQAAADLGTDYLEMDVQRTKDGVLIVNHDNTFARTTDITTVFPNRVNDLINTFTWDEITRLKNKGVPLLRLEDVINIALTHPKHPGLYIETKSPELYPGVERQLVDLLEAKAAFKTLKVYFQSFDIESVKKLKAFRPDVPRLYLSEERYSKLVKKEIPLAAQYATGIGPNFAEVGTASLTSFLALVHQNKLVAHFWTIDDPAQMQSLIEGKADGVFTNRTDILMGLCGLTKSRPKP